MDLHNKAKFHPERGSPFVMILAQNVVIIHIGETLTRSSRSVVSYIADRVWPLAIHEV